MAFAIAIAIGSEEWVLAEKALHVCGGLLGPMQWSLLAERTFEACELKGPKQNELRQMLQGRCS